MRSPSMPKIMQRAGIPSTPKPRPREVNLEAIKAEERKRLDRKKGFSSTVLTRGIQLGTARTQKARTFGE